MAGGDKAGKATFCPPLLVLVLWLMMVSAILYLTHEDGTYQTTLQNHEVLVSTRKKRAGDTLRPEEDKESQAQEVYVELSTTSNRKNKQLGRQVVHCSVVRGCHTNSLLADCHCSQCSVYTVVVREDGHVLPSLSATQLADLVTAYLRHRAGTTVNDLNQLVDVRCHHSQDLQLHLTGDVLPQPVCSGQRPGTVAMGSMQQRDIIRYGQEYGETIRNERQPANTARNGEQFEEMARYGETVRNDKQCKTRVENSQQWGEMLGNSQQHVETVRNGKGHAETVRNGQQRRHTMRTGQERGETLGNGQQQGARRKDIHILYFRYLSHDQLTTRLPGLMSLLQRAAREGWVRVDNLDNHQASVWGDQHVLSLLLQGRLGRFHLRGSVLDAARQGGYCFHLQDLSCRASRDQARLVTRALAAGRAVACRGHGQRHRKATVGRLCAAANVTTARLNALLLAALTPDTDQRPVLSVSVLSPRDPALLDTTLRNVFLQALSARGGLLVLLGGVGDPAFLRFDRSVLQQLHTSRPAMLLCDTSATGPTVLLRGAPIAMLHVHRVVKQLVTNISTFQTDTAVSREFEDSKSCQSLGVRPPFLCLQEEQYVPYENDTLMSGFAELAVALINAQIRNTTPAAGRHSHCGGVRGESFRNVKLGHYRQRYRVLMDLTLSPGSSSEVVVHHAVLDVWDTDRVARAELRLPGPGAVSPGSPSTRTLHALCGTEDSLDPRPSLSGSLLQRWSKERHFGCKAAVTHVHDNCLFLLVRDFGHSVSVQVANVCGDRRYDVTLRVSLLNMVFLTAPPLVVSLGHAQRQLVAVMVKVSYTVAASAYRLDPDFTVSYD